MFQKFAKADILEAKWSNEKLSGLQRFASHQSEPDEIADNGFLYVRVRAISSRVNSNYDGWPSEELQKSYSSFMHRPVFVDHHNDDPKRTRGVVVDAKIHVDDEHKISAVDPYYKTAAANHKPPTWVELLLEIDAQTFPKLAQAIIDGDIDSVSMGANVAQTTCNICGNKAKTASDFCKHVQHKGSYFDTWENGQRVAKIAYEDCEDFDFFEISAVFQPADETALMDPASIRQSSQSTAMVDLPLWFVDALPLAGLAAMTVGGGAKMLWDEYVRQFGAKPRPTKTVVEAIKQLAPGVEPNLNNMHQDPRPPFDRQARKTAQNPKPQFEMLTSPEKVDTLEQNAVCELCGSEMRDGECTVCRWEEPPEGLNNPDLEQAKKVDKKLEEQKALMEIKKREEQKPQKPSRPSQVRDESAEQQKALSRWHRSSVNPRERPILPQSEKTSDQPKKIRTIKNPVKPVESNMEKSSENGTSPDKTVDVEATGGVMDTKDPKSQSVEKAVEVSGDHTDTWGVDEGNTVGQADPVTSESMPNKGASSKTALETHPVKDPTSVDVEADTADEVGPPTTTWSEDKAAPPVTKEEAVSGGPIGDPASKASSHVFSALKVAELESEMGLLPVDEKYERAAVLEGESPEALNARLDTLSKVKTAGLVRTAAKRPSGTKLPSFRAVASTGNDRGLGDVGAAQIFM